MILYIAEKPELARAIVEGLGGGTRRDGYFECGADRVTWCFGHMLRLQYPEEYDPRFKDWNMADLPLVFIPWVKKPADEKGDQLAIIGRLLKQATEVVHAGDPDEEGQLLVDEILNFYRCRLPVRRLLINDNNAAVVRKALAAMRPNSEFAGLSAAAEARSVGDQLFGYNLTRAYTLAARAKGADGVLSVGRVQTPILGLVVRRDREHAAHVPVYYYLVRGDFKFGELGFLAGYVVVAGDPVDDQGRLCDQAVAARLAGEASGQPAVIESAVTREQEEAAPLPYNLLKLQMDAARKFGYPPAAVKEITQALREHHRLITYNRSDCEYLSDEQHGDAAVVLAAIGATAPVLASAAERGDPALKSRAFNSSKISAHHAIVPTGATADFATLSEGEQRIYSLIARAYIAQFWPTRLYDQTDLVVLVAGHRFGCRANVDTRPGWKNLYRNDGGDDDEAIGEGADLDRDLRELAADDRGSCVKADAERKATKPLPLYTMASLLGDLTRVARYIKDEGLRKLLVEKDAGKAGEHGGIGTPATRDSIIATLFDRGFLIEKGKQVVSSPEGRNFYDVLPDSAKFPDMTALWHAQQLEIRQGHLTTEKFIRDLVEYVRVQVEDVRRDGISIKVEGPACPRCGQPLRRRKGTNGFFWGCSGRAAGCAFTADDKGGKPVLEPKGGEGVGTSKHVCGHCGKPLQKRNGKNGVFWGCTGYPGCPQTYADNKGRPAKPPKAKVRAS